MSILLRRFETGDTDYIAKLNANVQAMEAAINGLQSASAGTDSPQNIAAAFAALFPANNDAVVGPDAWSTAAVTNGIRVQPGFAWVATLKRVGRIDDLTTIDMRGQGTGTYYLTIDASGAPVATDDDETGALYQFTWDGTNASDITRLALITWGAQQWIEAQGSEETGEVYETPDERFEALEGRMGTVEDEQSLHNLTASVAPTVDDDIVDGYSRASLWFDQAEEDVYICLDPAEGAAVWIDLTGGSAGGSAGGGSGGGSYAQSNIGGSSGSGYCAKGALIEPLVDMNMHGAVMTVTEVSGATYKAQLWEIGASDELVALAGESATYTGTVDGQAGQSLPFTSTATMSGGTRYVLLHIRTDATGTTSSGLYAGTGVANGAPVFANEAYATMTSTDPAIGETADLTYTNPYGHGYVFSLPGF